MLAALEVVLGRKGLPDRVGRGFQGLLNILFDYICLLNVSIARKKIITVIKTSGKKYILFFFC